MRVLAKQANDPAGKAAVAKMVNEEGFTRMCASNKY